MAVLDHFLQDPIDLHTNMRFWAAFTRDRLRAIAKLFPRSAARIMRDPATIWAADYKPSTGEPIGLD